MSSKPRPFHDSYTRFRGFVAHQQVNTGTHRDQTWGVYDHGPRIPEAVVCLPPASCTADVFFRQILSLCPKGYRIVALSYPVCFSLAEFATAFGLLLQQLRISQVHIVGASLGGFLALAYTQTLNTFSATSAAAGQQHPGSREYVHVSSLVLINSFCSTTFFYKNTLGASLVRYWPEFLLKAKLLQNLPIKKLLDPAISDSIDFVVLQLERLSRREVSARLALHCHNTDISELAFPSHLVTIIDTLDQNVLKNTPLRNQLRSLFPGAKIAEMRTGGDFPYLANAEEFNMYLEVHLRAHYASAGGRSSSCSVSDASRSPPLQSSNSVFSNPISHLPFETLPSHTDSFLNSVASSHGSNPENRISAEIRNAHLDDFEELVAQVTSNDSVGGSSYMESFLRRRASAETGSTPPNQTADPGG